MIGNPIIYKKNFFQFSLSSKLNTTMMDETHYQSLDEDRRRYTDEEQGN